MRRRIYLLRNTWILVLPLICNKRVSLMLIRIRLVYRWLSLVSSAKFLKFIPVWILKCCLGSRLIRKINCRVARCFGLFFRRLATSWSRNRRQICILTLVKIRLRGNLLTWLIWWVRVLIHV